MRRRRRVSSQRRAPGLSPGPGALGILGGWPAPFHIAPAVPPSEAAGGGGAIGMLGGCPVPYRIAATVPTSEADGRRRRARPAPEDVAIEPVPKGVDRVLPVVVGHGVAVERCDRPLAPRVNAEPRNVGGAARPG